MLIFLSSIFLAIIYVTASLLMHIKFEFDVKWTSRIALAINFICLFFILYLNSILEKHKNANLEKLYKFKNEFPILILLSAAVAVCVSFVAIFLIFWAVDVMIGADYITVRDITGMLFIISAVSFLFTNIVVRRMLNDRHPRDGIPSQPI